MALLFPAGYQFFDTNGDPLAAGTINFYITTTTTDKAIYSDKALTASASNPYTLDSSGRIAVNIYGSGDYTVLVKDSAGATVFSRDAVFGWDEIGDLDGSTGSSLVGFIHSAAGAVATTLQARGRLTITPQDFGATGDGVADDTAELQACINGADGREIDLQGLTYKVATTLSLVSDTTIKNGKISFATGSDSDVLFEAYGSTGTTYTPSAAPVKGDSTITILTSVAGLAIGDWCYLKSTDNFSVADSGKKGEWVRILSIATLTLTLEQRVRHTYTAGYVLYKPTLISNVTLSDLTLTGNGFTGSAAQYALRAYLCRNVNLIRCSADSFGYMAYSLETVLGGNVTDCNASRGNFSLGTAYGVGITGGCDGITVKGGRYSYLRHPVTVGGTYFTDAGITIQGITTFACSDAGVDAHPNVWGLVIDGCNIDCASTDTTQTGDGIVAQCAAVSITNNIVRGWRRVGILSQNSTSAPEAGDGLVISGNTLTAAQGTSGGTGITISQEKSAIGLRNVVIANNSINGADATTGVGIEIYTNASGGTLRQVSITGNSVQSRSETLKITSANLILIDDVAIVGNTFATLSASVPVISCVNGGTGYMTAFTFAANTIRGGTYGISLTGTAPTRMNRGLNVIQGFATAATTGTFAATDGTDVTT